MNLTTASDNYTGFHVQNSNRVFRITSDDLAHMYAFPPSRKQWAMEEIMSRVPTTSLVVTGHNHYEKTILRLRKDGFGLIDLQPQEFVLTSVWCRNVRSIIGLRRIEVAMLLWAVEEDSTNMTTWRI